MGNRISSGATLRVDGYRELRRDLLKLSPDVDALLKTMNIRIADDIIRTAQSYAARHGRQQQRAANLLKPYKSARAGGVNLRATARVPYAMGAEFGAKRPQLPAWRGNGRSAGYFLWPAIRDTNVLQKYSDGIAALLKEFRANG